MPKLRCPWTLWYHNPEDKRWDIDSYVKVMELTTPAEFWALFSKLTPDSLCRGMFFLMRDDIRPTWEDPRNMHGGCWSYKIAMSKVPDIWQDMAVQLVTDNLCTRRGLLSGISISPKRGFCVVKIWNTSAKAENSETSLLHATCPALNQQEAMYTAFCRKRI